jgi:hypothetical protein
MPESLFEAQVLLLREFAVDNQRHMPFVLFEQVLLSKMLPLDEPR